MYRPSSVIWWLKSISFPKGQHTSYPILHSNEKKKEGTKKSNAFCISLLNHVKRNGLWIHSNLNYKPLIITLHPSAPRRLSIPLNPFTWVSLLWIKTALRDHNISVYSGNLCELVCTVNFMITCIKIDLVNSSSRE